MRFEEGRHWQRIPRRYRYVLMSDLRLDLPVPVLKDPEVVAELLQDWKPGQPVPPAWVRVERRWSDDGQPVDHLFMRAGYAWDGASGALDTGDFMLPSGVHDGLYQMMREGDLPPSARGAADANMRELAIQQGMPRIRAWWVWAAVRLFGRRAAAARPALPGR